MRKKHDFKIFVNLKLCYLRPWLFLLAGILLIGMKQVYAQEEKTVTLNVDEQLVRSVLAQLKKMTGHIFVYKESLISKEKRVTLHFTDASLATVVAEICRQIGVRAEFDKQFILLLPDTPKTPVSSKITIRGKVTDADDNPLPGATVVQKGSVNGTVTNENGIYQLELNPKDAQSILFSFIGYKKNLRHNAYGNLRLRESGYVYAPLPYAMVYSTNKYSLHEVHSGNSFDKVLDTIAYFRHRPRQNTFRGKLQTTVSPTHPSNYNQ